MKTRKSVQQYEIIYSLRENVMSSVYYSIYHMQSLRDILNDNTGNTPLGVLYR